MKDEDATKAEHEKELEDREHAAEEEEGDEEEDDEEEEEVARKPEPKAKSSARPEARAASSSAKHSGTVSAGSSSSSSNVALVGILALAIGAAGGWFGHQAKAKAALRAESEPAAAGSSGSAGPCGAWEKKVCDSAGGDQSAACQEAKVATSLLTPSTCQAAIEALPATLAKVKAARAPCDALTTKLCKDLPPGSATCTMVKERTTRFPGERCGEMLKNYDQVLAEVKSIDAQGGMPPGGMPPGGGMPHGMPGMPPGVKGLPPGVQGMPQSSPPHP